MRRISPSRDELKGVPGSQLTTSSPDEPLDGNQALRDRIHRQEGALERDSDPERGTVGRDEARRGDARAIDEQAHFGHRPLGPLAPGDQHRLGAPDRRFQPLGQRSRDHEQRSASVDEKLGVFASARGPVRRPLTRNNPIDPTLRRAFRTSQVSQERYGEEQERHW